MPSLPQVPKTIDGKPVPAPLYELLRTLVDSSKKTARGLGAVNRGESPASGGAPLTSGGSYTLTGVTDHGDLTGLVDNDHPQYLLRNSVATQTATTPATWSGVQQFSGGFTVATAAYFTAIPNFDGGGIQFGGAQPYHITKALTPLQPQLLRLPAQSGSVGDGLRVSAAGTSGGLNVVETEWSSALGPAHWVDPIDSSKGLQFNLSGISPSTTRTWTVQNASGTVPLLEQANTWPGDQLFDTGIIFGNSSVFPETTYVYRTSGGENAAQVEVPIVSGRLALLHQIFTLDSTVITTTSPIDYTSQSVVFFCDSGITVTMPSASVVGAGRLYHMKNTGTGTTTIAAAGAQTIDGSSTKVLSSRGFATIVSDGTNWQLI